VDDVEVGVLVVNSVVSVLVTTATPVEELVVVTVDVVLLVLLELVVVLVLVVEVEVVDDVEVVVLEDVVVVEEGVVGVAGMDELVVVPGGVKLDVSLGG